MLCELCLLYFRKCWIFFHFLEKVICLDLGEIFFSISGSDAFQENF